MLQNGPAVSTATGVILGGNLFANFFVKFSLHSLLKIINTIQIILYLPLYKLATPGNTQIFFSFLMQIASFDYFPSDLVYAEFYPEKPNPINENFE
jgi:ABC-type nitrate/sulfonate/bicarbonate transport system permease component